MKRRIIILAVYLSAALVAGLAHGQNVPDRRGEIATSTFTYKNVTANAPIPAALHIRNEGGSDGAGLCVISSVLCNGQYQRVPGLEGGKESALWRTAKQRRGGYGPDKLADLVNEVMPGEKWASYVGRDTGKLDTLSKQGYPIGATMNTGQLYRYAPIHHMISLAHYSKSDGLACVVDNNDPGKYHWMPSTEFDRRWIDQGYGWAWIWLRKPSGIGSASLMLVFTAIMLVAGGLIIIATAFIQASHGEFHEYN